MELDYLIFAYIRQTFMDDGSFGFFAQLMVKGARVLRYFKIGKRIVSSVKIRASLDLTRDLHKEAIHRIRNLSSATSKGDWSSGGQSAIEMCTACRNIIGNLLELSEDQIHCCLKGFWAQECSGEDDLVITVARSEPFYNRHTGDSDAHLVKNNTVWSALLGENDGKYTWESLNCFHCGDLFDHVSQFQCTRANWEQHYRSTLVFPIFHLEDINTRNRKISGFLTFDSPQKNAFGKLPDVFSYVTRRDEYHTKIAQFSSFHLGALLADTLSIFLEPVCD